VVDLLRYKGTVKKNKGKKMQLNRYGVMLAGLLVAQGTAHRCEAQQALTYDIQTMENRRTMRIRTAVANVEKSLDDLKLSSQDLYNDIILVAYSWKKTVYAATNTMNEHNDAIKKTYRKLDILFENPEIAKLIAALTTFIEYLIKIINDLPFGSREFDEEGDLEEFYRTQIRRNLQPKLKKLKAAVENTQSVVMPKLQTIYDNIAAISLYMETTLIKELDRQIDPRTFRWPFFSFLFGSYYFSNPPEIVEEVEDDSWFYNDDDDDNDDDSWYYRSDDTTTNDISFCKPSDDGSCGPEEQKYCCTLKDNGEYDCEPCETDSCGPEEKTFCCPSDTHC